MSDYIDNFKVQWYIDDQYSDDGGSHNYQERFDEFPRMWIYGIEVKHEGI